MTDDPNRRDTMPAPPEVEIVDDSEAFTPGRRLKPVNIATMSDRALLELVAAETFGLGKALHDIHGLLSAYSANSELTLQAVDELRARMARLEGRR